jgi:hypothetical protein
VNHDVCYRLLDAPGKVIIAVIVIFVFAVLVLVKEEQEAHAGLYADQRLLVARSLEHGYADEVVDVFVNGQVVLYEVPYQLCGSEADGLVSCVEEVECGDEDSPVEP